MSIIKEMPVERDEYGCWTHPEYEKFWNSSEVSVPGLESVAGFIVWVMENHLEFTVHFMNDGTAPDASGTDISAWEPERPEGEGWFIGSIHATESGPVCVWLRGSSEAKRR
ncbi:hypothetical protein R0629_000874 [Escherichia coli]|nr:hypothetical protein [Escherichia coli]